MPWTASYWGSTGNKMYKVLCMYAQTVELQCVSHPVEMLLELTLLKTWQIKLYRKCNIACSTTETQYCMNVLLWRFSKKCRQRWKFFTPDSSSVMDILKFRNCLTSWFQILTVHVILDRLTDYNLPCGIYFIMWWKYQTQSRGCNRQVEHANL